MRQYLKNIKELDEMLIGGLYTSCGQVPRLRELVSLEIENSPTSARGICVWNGSVVYVIRHYKAKRTTNHEFNVVRFLLSRLGSVLVKYLVHIRGVAGILRSELDVYMAVSSLVENTRLLFHRYNKPWPTECVTAILSAAAR